MEFSLQEGNKLSENVAKVIKSAGLYKVTHFMLPRFKCFHKVQPTATCALP